MLSITNPSELRLDESDVKLGSDDDAQKTIKVFSPINVFSPVTLHNNQINVNCDSSEKYTSEEEAAVAAQDEEYD